MPLNVQCKRCANYHNEWCSLVRDSPDPDMARDCRHYKTLTNADRYRAMTDEELAYFLYKISLNVLIGTPKRGEIPKAWLDWLKAEAKEA